MPASNGLLIYDLSQIQARMHNPQVRLISQLLWKDGSVAQHTIPVKIDGKSYLIFVDEGGSGGGSGAAGSCFAPRQPTTAATTSVAAAVARHTVQSEPARIRVRMSRLLR